MTHVFERRQQLNQGLLKAVPTRPRVPDALQRISPRVEAHVRYLLTASASKAPNCWPLLEAKSVGTQRLLTEGLPKKPST